MEGLFRVFSKDVISFWGFSEYTITKGVRNRLYGIFFFAYGAVLFSVSPLYPYSLIYLHHLSSRLRMKSNSRTIMAFLRYVRFWLRNLL